MARMRVVVTVNENPVSLILRLYHYGEEITFYLQIPLTPSKEFS